MCVRCIDFVTISAIFLLDFRTVPKVWIFSVFHFIVIFLSLVAREMVSTIKEYDKVYNDCLVFQYIIYIISVCCFSIYIIIVYLYERVTDNCAIYK